MHAGRECRAGNFSPCHYHPCMCTRPRAQPQTREAWQGLPLRYSQTMQKHSPYVSPAAWGTGLAGSCHLASPCSAPGQALPGQEGSGERGRQCRGRKQAVHAQPAAWGFGEQIRATASPGLPSHHTARTQAQMSFGHVRRGQMTSYYRPKQGALCKVNHLSVPPISNVMALMSGWQFRFQILPRRIRIAHVHVFLGLLAIWAALNAMWFYTLPTFQASCIQNGTRESCMC